MENISAKFVAESSPTIKNKLRLWLDDKRDPGKFGREDWLWAMTAAEAIQAFRRGDIECASLDHDLTDRQMVLGGCCARIEDDGVMSGYDVILWLEQHPEYWPKGGVQVHSQNPAGRARMEAAIHKHYGYLFRL